MPMNASELVNGLKNKNEKALAQLYDSYAPALYGIILRILPSEPLAEEILQQTFLKIWNNIDNYDANKSRLFTWMSRIARNAAIDHYRLKGFKQQRKTTSIDITVHSYKTEKMNTSTIDVMAVLEKLDSKYKVILEHIYLLGYSHSDTARILNIPLGTVKTRLRVAIKQLRKQLEGEKKLFIHFLLIRPKKH